jgi:prolipoprotein diacylglyceryltransferase
MKADWTFVQQQLIKIILTIYIFWVLAGVIAILLAFSFPEDYNNAIYSVPLDQNLRLGYAWVGGSIWGGILGGLVAVVKGLINLSKAWKNQNNLS